MIHIGRFGKAVTVIAATCIAVIPGTLAAVEPFEDGGSVNVDKVFAVDAHGSIHALRILGESFDSGDLMSVTLADSVLPIERSSGTEIVAELPVDLAPGRYELVVSVTDEVNRVDQAVGVELQLPPSRSAARGNAQRLVFSSAENLSGLDPAASTKALSGYQRLSLSGSACPDNFFCLRRKACPTGYKVSGGGMAISGTTSTDAYLVESFPASNTSWEARILNQSGVSRTTTTWAICVK